MKKTSAHKWLILFSIIFFILACIMFSKGYDKMTDYYMSPSGYYSRNAYVNGDAYNYIINANYATGFYVLGGSFLIAAVINLAAGIMINAIVNGYTGRLYLEKPEPVSPYASRPVTVSGNPESTAFSQNSTPTSTTINTPFSNNTSNTSISQSTASFNKSPFDTDKEPEEVRNQQEEAEERKDLRQSYEKKNNSLDRFSKVAGLIVVIAIVLIAVFYLITSG